MWAHGPSPSQARLMPPYRAATLQTGDAVSFRRELGRFDTACVVGGDITGAGILIKP